jgi:hypothetical protein
VYVDKKADIEISGLLNLLLKIIFLAISMSAFLSTYT